MVSIRLLTNCLIKESKQKSFVSNLWCLQINEQLPVGAAIALAFSGRAEQQATEFSQLLHTAAGGTTQVMLSWVSYWPAGSWSGL